MKNFAQIVFLYPRAYSVRVEECKAEEVGCQGRFKYIVEANLVDGQFLFFFFFFQTLFLSTIIKCY